MNRDPEARYNPMAVADLAATYPNLRFDVMARTLGLPASRRHRRRGPADVPGRAGQPDGRGPLETWKTYARARTLSEAAGQLPAAFGQANFDFYGRVLNGQDQDRPRWKKAVGATRGALGEAIGRIYVDRHYPRAAADRMAELIENLREAFRQSIDGNPWMTDATKAEALDKLENYTYKIGHPDEWEDYSGLEVSPTDLIGNGRALRAWGLADNLAKLGEAPDRAEWGMTPQTVNAYYNPAFNEIVFPAAILQPPFFDVDADDAVNYGGIGAVIGHEFSHGFDDQGSQYDAQGNLRDWWTETDRDEFDARGDMLVAQYDAYEPFADASVNGGLTLGENIGDLSGLTMAYRAYRLSLDTDGDGTVSASEEAPVIDGFTGDQRFFMGWAQVWQNLYRDAYLRQLLQVDSHSPGEYRANGPLGPHPGLLRRLRRPAGRRALPPGGRADRALVAGTRPWPGRQRPGRRLAEAGAPRVPASVVFGGRRSGPDGLEALLSRPGGLRARRPSRSLVPTVIPVALSVTRALHTVSPAAMCCMGMIMCMARSGQERSRTTRR